VTSAGFAETLELALRLHPSTERVLVVARWPDLEPEALKEELRRFAQRVELSYVTDEPVPRLIEAVEAAPPRGLILYIRYSDENSATGAESTDVARRIVQASSVPVYGVAEGFIGSGVIGGAVFSTTGIAARIGQITRQILDGTLARDIPIQRATLVPMFDWRQLKRWGIAVDSLPPDSVLLFREISVWERYRGTILLTASVLLLQSLLIAGLVFEHRRRRRAEIESRRHLAAMAHLDRRAAMGELATSLAHELSQPLNAILQNAGVAQMLLTSATVPPALEEMADIIGDIRKDDIRASEVIRRMRGLLLKRELEAHPVDLNEVAQDAVAIVRPDARARAIDLETKLADDVSPIIVGDRVHLQQVLLNLLMNAMDAVATMPPERRRVHVSTTRRDDEVRLAVADSGVGIPADRLAEIFEPFYTTKGDDRGMGMGLAIARSIVEAHAGSMAAENNPGGGATVWFSVPATQGPPS
jgi:signal transduction histidine kinase